MMKMEKTRAHTHKHPDLFSQVEQISINFAIYTIMILKRRAHKLILVRQRRNDC